MKYTQSYRYQNIEGSGRNCDDRWDIISRYIKENQNSTSIDVGSAEGVFSKRLADITKGKVVSIEGSDFVHNEQLKYCKNEIENGDIQLHKTELNTETISNFLGTQYEYSLLLSVLHWCENPDEILKKISEISNYTFVELPDLEDEKSYGQDYLKRIKIEYGNIENYLQEITEKPIVGAYKVEGNNSKYRVVYVLHKSEPVYLVDIDDVYHMIHGEAKTIEYAYIGGNFEIVPISLSPVVAYLNGDTHIYNSQPRLFYRREKNISYLLNEYDAGNRDWLMKAVFYKGKYVMADGMHRSSVLKHNGYRKVFIKIISGPTEPTAIFEKFITDERFRKPKEEAKVVVNGTHLIGKVSLIKDVIQFGIGNDEVFKTNHSLSSKLETLLQTLTDIEGELNNTE
jgi:hypothetical protein